MPLIRVGIVPHIDDPAAQHLHRSALILAREPHELKRYARAQVGHLGEPARAIRLADVGAVVAWGSEDAALAKLLLRHPGAVVIVVTARKPAKDSAVTAALERLAANGCDIHVVPFGKRAKVKAMDIGPNRLVADVEDISRPPQQQHAPARPVSTEKAPEPPAPAPTMPRAPAPPVTPYEAPVMPRAAAAPAEPSPAPSVPREAPVEAAPVTPPARPVEAPPAPDAE